MGRTVFSVNGKLVVGYDGIVRAIVIGQFFGRRTVIVGIDESGGQTGFNADDRIGIGKGVMFADIGMVIDEGLIHFFFRIKFNMEVESGGVAVFVWII